jgi:hypothetical protein
MSRGLGQTELLDVKPSRRLIVPPEHVNWWGVDPSTVRIALATIDPCGRRGVSQEAFSGEPGAERLASIYTRTFTLAAQTSAILPPGVIVVEQPSGARPNPSLSYAVGVIIAALHAGVPGRPHVEMVSSSRWKSIACGHGGIRKPKPTSGEEYGVLTWARELGYTGSSWDDADAMGVAEYGRRTFALEPR